jgi:TatD DNase family protein
LERVLLETDSPYLAPVPRRGKRNESAYIPYIAERVAQIYGTTVENVAAVTTANAERLFAI